MTNCLMVCTELVLIFRSHSTEIFSAFNFYLSLLRIVPDQGVNWRSLREYNPELHTPIQAGRRFRSLLPASLRLSSRRRGLFWDR